jgi:hypothetical protein
MTSVNYSRVIGFRLLQATALCICLASPCLAQVQTTKSESTGTPTHQVTVERGEIVYVNGNTVVIKMEDGSLREFDNVPESTTFMVDGKPETIKTAHVGMKLEKQTVTTTTPKVVTTVETVTGKVWHVTPPNSVILTLENGQNQEFKIPKGQRFMVNGRETDAFGLRKGMNVSAQRVTEEPISVVTQQVKRTGTAPPQPTIQPDTPILVAVAKPAPAPAEAAPAPETPAKLPKTGSLMPLIGLLGAFLCSVSLLLAAARRIALGLPNSKD